MKKILIVEDHADIRKLIRMTLEFEDFEVLEAATGDEGLEVAHQAQPDIVLLDVMMPGTHDGLEVCRRIKRAPTLTHTRVVMLTACGRAVDMARGRRSGADDYLSKPFSTRQILDSIHQMEAPA
ncbi:response regulator transcription factor [Paenacidovorax monticola]|uniref:Response regulator n=1 Tax=Paenacidovorax monticola TaxID=1926868 RepID=A0A7H0HER1_9BURK|nr:response regulator [Paenacidovorax monticola]QNP59027.1 response regulator [Paenacidovorax monticola]